MYLTVKKRCSLCSVFLSEWILCNPFNILNRDVCKYSELYNELDMKSSLALEIADTGTILLNAENRKKSARSMSQPVDRCTSRVFVFFFFFSRGLILVSTSQLPSSRSIAPSLCSFSSSRRPSTAALAVYFPYLQYVKWIFLLFAFLGFFFFVCLFV